MRPLLTSVYRVILSLPAICVALFLSLAAIPLHTEAHDQPCDWSGSVDDDWFKKDNWLNCDGGVPQSHDDVVIGNQPTRPAIGVLQNDVVIQNLSLQGGALYVGLNRTLTAQGRIQSTGGTLEAQGAINGPVDILPGGITQAWGNFGGAITVAPLATLQLTGGSVLNARNNVTINGSLTSPVPAIMNFSGQEFANNGSVATTVLFLRGGAQTIRGSGQWAGSPRVAITNGSAATLADSMTFAGNRLEISNGGTLNIGSNSLTLDDTDLLYVDIDSRIDGAGTIFAQNQISVTTNGPIVSPFTVLSGVTSAGGVLQGPVSVAAGATLAAASGAILDISNKLIVTGTLAGSAVYLDGPNTTFTNNGSVTASAVQFRAAGQTLQGTGAFTKTTTTTVTQNATMRLGSDHRLGKLIISVLGGVDLGGRTLTLLADGAPLTASGTLTTTNSTVVYGGTASQTVTTARAAYHNLTLDNAAGTSAGTPDLVADGRLTAHSGAFTAGNCTCNEVVIDLGATLVTTPSATLMVAGNWTNNGSFQGGKGSAVVMNGTAKQEIGGSTTFANLTIANATVVTLTEDSQVNGVLTLKENLSTGDKVLTMGADATSAGNGDVFGKVKRTGPFVLGTSYSFGSPFTSLTFESGTLPEDVLVELIAAQPSIAGAARRTYIITPQSESFTASLRLHYRDSELPSADESDLQLWYFDTTQKQWAVKGFSAGDAADNWLELFGANVAGQWAIAPGGDRIVFLPGVVNGLPADR